MAVSYDLDKQLEIGEGQLIEFKVSFQEDSLISLVAFANHKGGGGLFGNLTLEQLKQDNYQAQTRNKLIAESFYLIGEIEKYGSEFLRIRDEIKTYPTMELFMDNAPNGLMTSLKYSQQKMTDKFTDEFTDSMIKIIELVRKHPRISLNEMAESVGITKRGVINNTNKLKKLGAFFNIKVVDDHLVY